MGVDEELRRAGRDLVDRSTARQTPSGLRRVHERRRRTRLVIPGAAVLVAGAMLWPGGDGESSVDSVDMPTSSTAPAEETSARIESGQGPTTVVAADGTPLSTLDGKELVPGEGDLAMAVMNEVRGVDTGWDSSASVALAAAGLTDRPDDVLAQMGDAGLIIETTIDMQAQTAAIESIDAAALGPELSAAMWSIDPTDGATVALAGPTALVDRQAGGAIRPAMMAVALESGVAADERLANPASLTIPVEGAGWEVRNFGGQGSDPVTLGEALAIEANTPWIGLVADGRIDEAFFADVAERFGLRIIDPAMPSMVLGVFNTDLSEVAAMTAVFATDGSKPDVHLINRISNREGVVLFDRTALPTGKSAPIVEPATRDAVRAAMADVVCCGTGTAAKLGGAVEQIGKTGTIPDAASAWFTGSTPALTTAVWVGGLDQMPIQTDPPLSGGGEPASIWADYTEAVGADDPGTFPR